MTWHLVPSKEEIALLMEAGFIYRDMQRFEEARQIFLGVSALFPKSEVPEVALGTVAFHQSDFKGALQRYGRALELNPSSAYAYAHAGEAHLFNNDKERARANLETAIRLDPRGDTAAFARHVLQLSEMVHVAAE